MAASEGAPDSVYGGAMRMRAAKHIFHLGIKELISLFRDPVLLFLIAYTFTFSVYTPSKSAVMIAMEPGTSSAPDTPCRILNTTSSSSVGARPQRTDVTPNPTSPTAKTPIVSGVTRNIGRRRVNRWSSIGPMPTNAW